MGAAAGVSALMGVRVAVGAGVPVGVGTGSVGAQAASSPMVWSTIASQRKRMGQIVVVAAAAHKLGTIVVGTVRDTCRQRRPAAVIHSAD